MTRTLHVHLGYPKTGSTAIQFALRHDVEKLKRAGLHYILSERERNAGPEEIGSGNAARLLKKSWRMRSRFRQLTPPSGDAVLSSELLWWAVEKDLWKQDFFRIARELGFDRIRLLVFSRDPVGHATSLYGQYVKRGGETRDVEAFLNEYRDTEILADFLDHVNGLPGVETTVLNFARHRADLVGAFSEWLGLQTPLTGPEGTINRSLTPGEIAMMRHFNATLGKKSSMIADRLCQHLPAIIAKSVVPAEEVQQKFLDRVAPAVKRINAHLPAHEHTEMRLLPPTRDEALTLNEAQIRVIGDALREADPKPLR